MTARLYTFAGLTALAGLAFLWLALRLPGGEAVTTLIGPRTWPLAILVTLMALVTLLVVLLALRGPAQFAGGDDAAPEEEITDDAVTRDHVHGASWRHLAVLAMAVAYTVSMEWTGYLLSTAFFAAVVTVLLGERRPLRLMMTTGGAVLMVAVVFDRLLNIPLP